MVTPGGASFRGATPLRDKLSINPDESADMVDDDNRELKESLKLGLSSLPAPKNDFEIVVPEAEDQAVDESGEGGEWVDDQADLDHLTEEEFRRRREKELRLRSQAVRRDLPRPTDMNHTILRPLNAEPPLTDLQVMIIF